jgi:hypothetical protein
MGKKNEDKQREDGRENKEDRSKEARELSRKTERMKELNMK